MTAIAAGMWFSLALDRNGMLWGWGRGAEGQLANEIALYKTIFFPVNGVSGPCTNVAGGFYHSMLLKGDGTVFSFGNNFSGELGDGTNVSTNRPVQVWDLSGITGIACGASHSLALKNDGTVWAWGDNFYGQLGNGTNLHTNLPVQASGISGVTALKGGGNHTLALKNDGTVWAWGINSKGQLGNGNLINSFLPVQVTNLSGVSAVSGGFHFSLALKNDGTVWSWGANNFSQLGNGTSVALTNVPVQVLDLSGIISVAGGGYHALALKNDGTVWAWGYNNAGQLGNGTVNNETNRPTQVWGITNAVAIDAGLYHSLAVLADGTAVTWGLNANGQLGHSFLFQQTVPLKIILEPSAPAGLVAGYGINVNHVPVSWNPSLNATTYALWKSADGSTSTAAMVASGLAVTNYEDVGAVPGVLYYYWAQASNACGTSPFSPSDSGWRLDISPGVSADYDGDAKADPAVYIEENGVWQILLSSANYGVLVNLPQPLGGAGYSAAPEDYDGDRLADPCVYERDTGTWQVMLSTANYVVVPIPGLLGGPGCWAIASDYDGDRKADPAVYAESSGNWIVKFSSAGYVEVALTQLLGGTGWIPVPADYDGDAKADPAVRSETGNEWQVMFSTAGYSTIITPVQFE